METQAPDKDTSQKKSLGKHTLLGASFGAALPVIELAIRKKVSGFGAGAGVGVSSLGALIGSKLGIKREIPLITPEAEKQDELK